MISQSHYLVGTTTEGTLGNHTGVESNRNTYPTSFDTGGLEMMRSTRKQATTTANKHTVSASLFLMAPCTPVLEDTSTEGWPNHVHSL